MVFKIIAQLLSFQPQFLVFSFFFLVVGVILSLSIQNLHQAFGVRFLFLCIKQKKHIVYNNIVHGRNVSPYIII
jgi:hypothetical protein